MNEASIRLPSTANPREGDHPAARTRERRARRPGKERGGRERRATGEVPRRNAGGERGGRRRATTVEQRADQPTDDEFEVNSRCSARFFVQWWKSVRRPPPPPPRPPSVFFLYPLAATSSCSPSTSASPPRPGTVHRTTISGAPRGAPRGPRGPSPSPPSSPPPSSIHAHTDAISFAPLRGRTSANRHDPADRAHAERSLSLDPDRSVSRTRATRGVVPPGVPPLPDDDALPVSAEPRAPRLVLRVLVLAIVARQQFHVEAFERVRGDSRAERLDVGLLERPEAHERRGPLALALDPREAIRLRVGEPSRREPIAAPARAPGLVLAVDAHLVRRRERNRRARGECSSRLARAGRGGGHREREEVSAVRDAEPNRRRRREGR